MAFGGRKRRCDSWEVGMTYTSPEHRAPRHTVCGSRREFKNATLGWLPRNWSRPTVLVLVGVLLPLAARAQTVVGSSLPIIDMHVHALPADMNTGTPRTPSAVDEESFKSLAAALAKRHVVRAVVSGPLEYVERMAAAAPGVVIAALAFPFPMVNSGCGDLRCHQLWQPRSSRAVYGDRRVYRVRCRRAFLDTRRGLHQARSRFKFQGELSRDETRGPHVQ